MLPTDAGVVYLFYGTKHALQLVVSLWSLRQVYRGPVAVLCAHDQNDATSLRLMEQLEAEPRAGVQCIPYEFVTTGRRHNGYANKTLIHKLSPFHRNVFLDADTLVVARFDELFPTDDEVVLTQFCQWWSDGRRISRRVDPWKEVAPELVARMQHNHYPAINTGVFGFTRATAYMDPWRALTLKRMCFICDELASQLMFPDYPHRVLDHRYNASVVYSIASPLVQADVRIWHGHGGKFFRKPTGRAIWRPHYDACVAAEFARIHLWTPYRSEADFMEVKRCTIFNHSPS